LAAVLWSTVVMEQREQGLTTRKVIWPMRTSFQSSPANGSHPLTIRSGRKRFMGTGCYSQEFRSAREASEIIRVMRGNRRCDMNRPAPSTSIQRRSCLSACSSTPHSSIAMPHRI
jgi:hypothetical protein